MKLMYIIAFFFLASVVHAELEHALVENRPVTVEYNEKTYTITLLGLGRANEKCSIDVDGISSALGFGESKSVNGLPISVSFAHRAGGVATCYIIVGGQVSSDAPEPAIPPDNFPSSSLDKCVNGIHDYNEDGVDCGGPCRSCPSLPQVCYGCIFDTGCLPVGTRLSGEYCDISKTVATQKTIDSVCQNDFECQTNECSDGKCINLVGELRETRSLMETIISWLRNFLGFDVSPTREEPVETVPPVVPETEPETEESEVPIDNSPTDVPDISDEPAAGETANSTVPVPIISQFDVTADGDIDQDDYLLIDAAVRFGASCSNCDVHPDGLLNDEDIYAIIGAAFNPSPYTCSQLMSNGPPDSKINIFVISDGFNESQNVYFGESIERALSLNGTGDGMFSRRPYEQKLNSFNIYIIRSQNTFNCPIASAQGPGIIPCNQRYLKEVVEQTCNLSSIDSEEQHAAGSGNDFLAVVANVNPPRNGGAGAGIGMATAIARQDNPFLAYTLSHELGGHAIGLLGDEYFLIDRYDITERARVNIDSEGCPTWCSGIVNTSNPCYQTYLDWQQCVNNVIPSPQSQISSEAIAACYMQAELNESQHGRPIDRCDLGISCQLGTGCYWGGGYSFANFRPHTIGIMSSGFTGTYGQVSEEQIANRINEIIANLD